MTIDELLERLNARPGQPASRTITARMLEDWAYEDLIPGPTRAGGTREPNWQWSEESLVAALKVIEYRSRGFKRSAAIRAQRWLEDRGLKMPLDREAVVSEFKRARNLLVRLVSSNHGFRRDITLSEYRRLALLRQLGPLDPVFQRAGVNPGEEVFILLYELARFGEQITPLEEDRAPLAVLLAKARLPNGAHILAGLLEEDDTHPLSAVRSIRGLSPNQLKECRVYASMLPSALAFGRLIVSVFAVDPGKKSRTDSAYSAVLTSVQRWPWMIFTFAMVANIMYKSTLIEDEALAY